MKDSVATSVTSAMTASSVENAHLVKTVVSMVVVTMVTLVLVSACAQLDSLAIVVMNAPSIILATTAANAT